MASLLTVVLVALMCASILLTSGKAEGSKNAVLSSVDEAGTRVVLVRGDVESGLNTDSLGVLSRVQGASWVGAFSAATDYRNNEFDGIRVSLRSAYSSSFDEFDIPGNGYPGVAYGTAEVLESLGLSGKLGAVRSVDGSEILSVRESGAVPQYLAFLEPALLVPSAIPTEPQTVNLIAIVAADPDYVSGITASASALVVAEDKSKIRIETSEQFAQLRASVESQLSQFSQSLVIAISAVGALLILVVQYGMTLLRRKDYGRRRALGASRLFIINLVLLQTALCALVGAAAGSLLIFGALASLGDPQPSALYYSSVAAVAVGVGVFAAVVPAFIASSRQPILELRTP